MHTHCKYKAALLGETYRKRVLLGYASCRQQPIDMAMRIGSDSLDLGVERPPQGEPAWTGDRRPPLLSEAQAPSKTGAVLM